MNTNPPKAFSYGGQAVLEGVMMRGAHKFAVAARNPEGGISIYEAPVNTALYRGRISRTPFLRGVVGLWDALGLGTRALMWSADVAVGEEDSGAFTGPLGIATLAVSLAFSVAVFFLFPTAAATGVENLLGLQGSPFLVNLIEGVIQLALIVGYMWLLGRLPDVKRLFGYHGAEHKTINAYESGAPLTPEVVQTFPIEHPRCGTAFLLTVAFVSVFVFSLFGRPPFLLLILSRVIFIPVIAGVAYEIIQFTAAHMSNPLIRAITIPNLALQRLTTRQPDLAMIEVAIAAFKRVLVSESLMDEKDAPAVTPVAEQAAAAD